MYSSSVHNFPFIHSPVTPVLHRKDTKLAPCTKGGGNMKVLTLMISVEKFLKIVIDWLID